MGLEISYIGGLELEYARLTDFIPGPTALQSGPHLAAPASQRWIQQAALRCVPGPGWMSHPPGIELGGSERVVRAAGQAAKRNPAPPFFRRKDKGCLERAVLWGFRTRRGVQNQPEAKKISPPFLRKGKEKARRPNMVCI